MIITNEETLKAIRKLQPVCTKCLAQYLEMSEGGVRRRLEKLRQAGLIHDTGAMCKQCGGYYRYTWSTSRATKNPKGTIELPAKAIATLNAIESYEPICPRCLARLEGLAVSTIKSHFNILWRHKLADEKVARCSSCGRRVLCYVTGKYELNPATIAPPIRADSIGVSKFGWRQRCPMGPWERRQVLKKYGKKAFLEPETLSYPVVDKFTGRYDCEGILAAYRRARQYKRDDIAQKALALAKRLKCDWRQRTIGK